MKNHTRMPVRIRELWGNWHPEERQWLDELRDTILAQYQDAVQRVVLFGSKARGDWHEESDVDVLVIVRDAAVAKKPRDQTARRETVRRHDGNSRSGRANRG